MNYILTLLRLRPPSLDTILGVFHKITNQLKSFLDRVEAENNALEARVAANKTAIAKARKALSSIETVVN